MAAFYEPTNQSSRNIDHTSFLIHNVVKARVLAWLGFGLPFYLTKKNILFSLQNKMKDTKKEGSTLENEEDESIVYVFDRREGNNPEHRVQLGGIFNFAAFREKVCQVSF